MDGRYGMYSQGSSSWPSMMGNEEFHEEDVWSVLKDNKDYNSKVSTSKESTTTIIPRHIPSASRIIPKPNNNLTNYEPKLVQQSAPVNLPDSSKIYGKKKKKKNIKVSWHDDDDDDDDGDMIPPHEWLANKLARSQISTSSVCEGAGRTLKGRDLSRVRNAVLTKTGFLE